mmetsp:Transcript_10732/g.17785  ORF Transcript_10732/g.17785 Transcript_10732/m.17785 type:complete len:300 (+) Transcript_10732:44-943(+)|eukprot:CAMPEP_0119004852 /NCGR_PEP_ID=MMETSP1176-20130426/1391_1 /TAXON_ID=265551 /ORGANISM="Synedropsis recta cf, Strain CCMP1620" /LENGTH=299 /DNA_ID=CAMNT_0006956607 /DNA_START=27 /DNA_END=926 /DNA_ORIENTATION=-
MHSLLLLSTLMAALGGSRAFVVSNNHQAISTTATTTTTAVFASPSEGHHVDRRQMLQWTAAALVTTGMPSVTNAVTVNGADSGNLPELPPNAIRSYLQYRIPLQISADYYLWDLQEKLGDTQEWGAVGELFRVNNNKGQGQPSKIERDFINPMRILSLSMPPDTADELRDSQFAFEKAMQKITKATYGIRRDLPVEIEASAVPNAKKGWEEGRIALNAFFKTLNDISELNELKLVPAAGANQNKEYGRSERRYLELAKKTKLCQNRGGPALSQAWGGLMISGYLQDSCGIPDLEDYFYQ